MAEMKLNRDQALKHAADHWNDYDNDYMVATDNDCTNFVSQCWHKGGIGMTADWYTYDKDIDNSSYSWTIVDAFADYMTYTSSKYTDNGLPIAKFVWSSHDVQPGDIVQFYNDDLQEWSHAGLVVKVYPSGKVYYAAHTDNVKAKDLNEVYPNGGYSQVRFIQPVKADPVTEFGYRLFG